MDLPSGSTGELASEPPAVPRQRWRLVLARSADAPELAGRELLDAFEQAIEGTGLPVHRPTGRLRTRVALAAPLPAGTEAERELLEIVLTETVPVWRVRDALSVGLPAGWRLIDLHDVWLGSPALAGCVTGAVYRIVTDATDDAGAIRDAATALLEARQLPRVRLKGGNQVTYDLRPLLAGIALVDPGPPVVLRVETRIHPERGSGRPEEVLATLADHLGRPLPARSIVRERLILLDEPV